MGRRALLIALAAFAVIALGAVITWAIIASSAPVAAPSPSPTASVAPDPTPSSTPEPSETPEPSATPTSAPTTPADPAPAPVTALAAKPAPHKVTLTWTRPADDDIARFVVVAAAGAAAPASPDDGKVIAQVGPLDTTAVDKREGLEQGKKYSYSVFAVDTAGVESTAASVTATIPAALVITPVDVTGEVTQQAADAVLTDSGSFAFTAFAPAGPRIAVVQPAAGVTGTMTRAVTEPKGAAAGAVTWTYSVDNAKLRSLAEGAKRDEVFVIELRDGADKARTTVTVTLRGINDAPTASAVPTQTAFAGDAFAFPIPADTFADVDATDTLTLTAGALPGWLSFNGTGFTGQPGAGDVGTVTVSVTATDPHGASVSTDVAIEVSPPMPVPNQAPVPVADDVTFDVAADPLQATAQLLANDTDPDSGPNALSAIPASNDWLIDGELAGTYSIDASGAFVVNSGVVADGPVQRLAAGEQATATITYSVTDGTDTVQSQVNLTIVGAASAEGAYGVTKVLVPPGLDDGRGLGRAHGAPIG